MRHYESFACLADKGPRDAPSVGNPSDGKRRLHGACLGGITLFPVTRQFAVEVCDPIKFI